MPPLWGQSSRQGKRGCAHLSPRVPNGGAEDTHGEDAHGDCVLLPIRTTFDCQKHSSLPFSLEASVNFVFVSLPTLEATFDGNRMGDFPFMPEVPGMLQHLAAKGIAAVIITNGHHKVQRDKLMACNAAALFPNPEKIIVGGEEVLEGRDEKPAVSIFMKACCVAGCEPEEAIHVGDSLATDVKVRRGRTDCLHSRHYLGVVFEGNGTCELVSFLLHPQAGHTDVRNCCLWPLRSGRRRFQVTRHDMGQPQG